MHRTITTYYLEITSLDQLRPKRTRQRDFEIIEAKTPSPEFGLFLYTTAGRKWYWLERVDWTRKEWLDHLERPEVHTWVGYLAGTPAGYTELIQGEDGVQIAYFGLFPQFIGQGLGAHLLTSAIEEAWRMEPKRVWVHTCTMDHPSALPNYKARGMRVYREETFAKDLPEATPGPWGMNDE